MKDTAYAEKIQHINKLNKNFRENEQVTLFQRRTLDDTKLLCLMKMASSSKRIIWYHLTIWGSLLVDQSL